MNKNATENRNIISLGLIFMLRMLGAMMIYPILSLYALQLKDSTPQLVGLALGIYGLTQALFQIPLGMLSDKLGRKTTIALGLLIFAAGSVVAALSSSIEGVIIGRAIQGVGAVGSTILALVADLTPVERRTKAMAMIGMMIGFSFSIAIVLGPMLNAWIGLAGIFSLTALLALLAIGVIFFNIPNPPKAVFHSDTGTTWSMLGKILKNTQLLRLNFGIFAVNAIFTASFIAIPLNLEIAAGLHGHFHGYLYLPILIVAFILMLPAVIIAEKKRLIKPVLLASIGLLTLSELSFSWFSPTILNISLGLVLFFTAFTILEACLPSLVSKLAPAGSKGTAMGLYSSSQFLGIFAGGLGGGILYAHNGANGLFIACALLGFIWLLLSSTMAKPPALRTYFAEVGDIDAAKAKQLSQEMLQIPGVAEAIIIIEEQVAHLKIDSETFEEKRLKSILS